MDITIKVKKLVWVEEELPEDVEDRLIKLVDERSKADSKFAAYSYDDRLRMIYEEVYYRPYNCEDMYVMAERIRERI